MNCLWCKKEIIGRRVNAIYCSGVCKQKKYYSNNEIKEREFAKRRSKEYRLINRVRMLNKRKDLRLEVLKIVGRGKTECFNCGQKDIRILQINHINGGGSKEHKAKRGFIFEIASGRRKIEDLNILCGPCNWLHFFERKYNVKYQIKPISYLSNKQEESEITHGTNSGEED